MAKFDALAVIQYIDNHFHVADIIETERGDNISSRDQSVSCVAHQDKDPSLRVYSEPGRHSFCFSCGKTYTPYLALKHLTGLSFNDIVSYLEENYGMVLPDSLDLEEADTQSNEQTAQRIRYLRKYMSPKVLNLVQKSLYVDAKEGGSGQIKKLYDTVVSIKEPGQI